MDTGEGPDPEWVEQLKHGGGTPLMDLEACSNGWSLPPGDLFLVRGPDYFTNRLKVPGGKTLLQPLAFDWVKSNSKVLEILNLPNSRVAAALERIPSSSPTSPFVWAFNLQLPSADNYSAIFYFVSYRPFPEGSLVDKFLKGDEGFRNSRLKLIANIAKGPWIVKTAVGEQAVVILGRALTCKYSSGEKFLEVDVDIGSSVVASAIIRLAIGSITTMTVDLAFLIEGQQDDELPEKILGAVRFGNLELHSAVPVEMMSAENNPGSLGSRLWKGFTTLLNPGTEQQQQLEGENNKT